MAAGHLFLVPGKCLLNSFYGSELSISCLGSCVLNSAYDIKYIVGPSDKLFPNAGVKTGGVI